MNEPLSQVLDELRPRLRALYGPRLDRLILFGSHARGDAEPNSDIDVLVVLKDEGTRDSEREGKLDIICDLSLKYGTVVSCIETTSEKIDHSGMPFYRNVRQEGVAI